MMPLVLIGATLGNIIKIIMPSLVIFIVQIILTALTLVYAAWTTYVRGKAEA